MSGRESDEELRHPDATRESLSAKCEVIGIGSGCEWQTHAGRKKEVDREPDGVAERGSGGKKATR